jgi:hypothetical protein
MKVSKEQLERYRKLRKVNPSCPVPYNVAVALVDEKSNGERASLAALVTEFGDTSPLPETVQDFLRWKLAKFTRMRDGGALGKS